MGHMGGTRRDLEWFAEDVLAKVLALKKSFLWRGYYQMHSYDVQIAVGWQRKMQEYVVPCPPSMAALAMGEKSYAWAFVLYFLNGLFFKFPLKVILLKNGVLEEKRNSSHFQVKPGY